MGGITKEKILVKVVAGTGTLRVLRTDLEQQDTSTDLADMIDYQRSSTMKKHLSRNLFTAHVFVG